MWMNHERCGILIALYGNSCHTKKEDILSSMKTAGYSGADIDAPLRDLKDGKLIERPYYGRYRITERGREAVRRLPYKLRSPFNESN